MGEKKVILCSLIIVLLTILSTNAYAATNISDITDVAEFGSTKINSSWRTVNLTINYSSPVIIAKPIKKLFTDIAHVRINNVTTNSFEIKVEEWAYQDGEHINETVSYIVMEEGSYILRGNLIQAGLATVNSNFSDVYFSEAFSSDPIILAQSNIINDSEPIVTRLGMTNHTLLFAIKLQEEENSSDSGNHVSEWVGYIAAEKGNYSNTTTFEIGVRSFFNSSWKNLNFIDSFSNPPTFLADMQSFNGADTAELRYRFLNQTGVQVVVEEERSLDYETNHCNEDIGYFVLE